MTKYINEHFLDEESEIMYYIWAILYFCYLPQGQEGVLFRSRHKGLIEIIKRESESEHAIISDTREDPITGKPRSSHWIEMDSAPYLRSRLGKLGLNVPKEKRRFPKKINEKRISHFGRGVSDARARIRTINNRYNVTRINFNPIFLSELNRTLDKLFDIKGRLDGRSLFFRHNDSIKFHDVIYQDFDFIQENGLYLPFKKRLFNPLSHD